MELPGQALVRAAIEPGLALLRTALGGGLAGGLPSSGISGDIAGAADLARRLFEQGEINDGNFWPSAGFAWISEFQARGIVPLTAGLRLISGVCMQMPLRQYRGESEILPPATIIRNPAPAVNGTLASYVDGYTNDVNMYGNHVCLLGDPDSTGWPSSLLPVDVTKVSVARDQNGRVVYTYDDLGTDETLTPADVLHVALDRRSGELRGRGMIPTLAAALRNTVEAEEYAGRYFSESAIPTGVITDSRPDLTQDQATALKAAWRRTVGGRRREPIVLPASTTFTALVSDADKAQLVEARQWNAQTVAMALGIPPFLLGVGAVPHVYTNAENEFGRLIRTTINRLIVPLQQAISLQCLPAGNDAVFDPRPLLRPEASVRATMAVQLYAGHVITQEEARDLAGFPAEGGPGEAAADEPGFAIDPITGATLLPNGQPLLPAGLPTTPPSPLQPPQPEGVPQ